LKQICEALRLYWQIVQRLIEASLRKDYTFDYVDIICYGIQLSTFCKEEIRGATNSCEEYTSIQDVFLSLRKALLEVQIASILRRQQQEIREEQKIPFFDNQIRSLRR
jgi:hypothetical protein